MNPPTNN